MRLLIGSQMSVTIVIITTSMYTATTAGSVVKSDGLRDEEIAQETGQKISARHIIEKWCEPQYTEK